ncbi:hypothetical protein ACJJTC_010525 [Scirpophaga incertulas]
MVKQLSLVHFIWIDPFDTMERFLGPTFTVDDTVNTERAKKLRKYPERMRNSIMYKIDGLLLDNPYPDERPSSSSTFYSEPYQYTPAPSRQYTLTPSPQYAPTPSPQYAPTASPQYAPNPSPQYVPNQNTTVTSEPPIYIRIPEENIRVQEDLGNQVHILSEEVIVPAKISNINAYNDS